jgi:uncharacterized SAM-binding protein YcdF (DUF218 family)
MRKLMLTFLTLAALALLAEAACYFICIPLASTGRAADADLLAVFGGAPEVRYLAAAKFEARGHYKAFCFSDTPAQHMATYQKLWGPITHAQVLIEPEARSTTQNAQFIARLIRQHRFHSVTVVTSWYHVPRSWVLMQLAVLGQGVTVHMAAADPVPENYWVDPVFWQEQLKLWASLASEVPWVVDAAQKTAHLLGKDKPVKWAKV